MGDRPLEKYKMERRECKGKYVKKKQRGDQEKGGNGSRDKGQNGGRGR